MKTPPKIEIEIKLFQIQEYLKAIREKYYKPNRVTDNEPHQNKNK